VSAALRRRGVEVALGLVADRLLPEPPSRWHPVAGFGTVMSRVEHAVWADRCAPGALYTVTGTVVGAVAGRMLASTPAAVTLCVAGAELRRVAERIERLLLEGDLDGARAALPALVGRDPSELDESGVSAAVIESLAENAVDAVVAPVCWAVLLGPAGAGAYRAVNTMDAMVGHRSTRYRHFGTPAARADDIANWVPARIYAALLALAAPGSARRVLRVVRRDAPRHPSPNAGVAEAAMAAILGVELGGPVRYAEEHQDRPRLGDGPRPQPHDIRRALGLSRRTEDLLVLALVSTGLARPSRGTRGRAQPPS